MKEYSLYKKIMLICFLQAPFVLFAQWQNYKIDTLHSFRSIHVLDKNTIWAGGTKGTVLKSNNGGKTWENMKVKDAELLDFRDIHAWDAKTALVMAAGNGENGMAKIFKTIDGGVSWKMVFVTTEKGTFFDSIDFLTDKQGFLVGDVIDGKPYILKTTNAGESWKRISTQKMPNMKPKEASFAASGTSLIANHGKIWICTQGRILTSSNKGKTWQVFDTPFEAGESRGIFGLHFWSANEGVAVGGDYRGEHLPLKNIAITHDGGKTWQFVNDALPQGLKEAAFLVNNKNLIVTGPSGTSTSSDFGKTWQVLDSQPFHAMSCQQNTCWLIGGKGRLASYEFRKDNN